VGVGALEQPPGQNDRLEKTLGEVLGID